MSTGLPGLDSVLDGVLPGDNIVFQVDGVDDYVPFVRPFCEEAVRESRALIYFRFAEHDNLVPEDIDAHRFELHPDRGFEHFISEIFDVIERFGTGACYVFDCLSDLSADWYSDRMLANFFMLTCPYLYDWETATFFSLLRNRHMALATNAIHDTAQVVIDVYRHRQRLYVHPLKVYKRYSPTMYMLHGWEGETFAPVTKSAVISAILSSVPQPWLDFALQRRDVWTRTFTRAQRYLARGDAENPGEDGGQMTSRLLRMAISRDKRLLEPAGRFFDLADLVNIGKRMIGTGLIGGKSVGMLLARAILRKRDPRWSDILEEHDSFFIGSDVFYTYLVVNGCWWIRRRLKKSGMLLDGSEEVRQRILAGKFPEDIQAQFADMLDYFGQSPIIVRSSSLLEDAYGNAFSGKYESVFCGNQGTPSQRLEQFMQAVRIVYASTMRTEALAYRDHWGLLDRDEQMALLVQRVSGEKHGDLYLPQVAGVGFSFNPYVWSPEIDPGEGMLRLVFGLGTRAVDRCDDDYTRVVALNAPRKRPESNLDEVRKYAQRKVDLLDLSRNTHTSRNFEDVARACADLPLDIFASRDEQMEQRAREYGMHDVFSYVLTFDKLLGDTSFVEDMRTMLSTLQEAYAYPVDIEFTANFTDDGYKINLVQCRPFQVKGQIREVEIPEEIPRERIVFETRGPIVGNSTSIDIDLLAYVVPSAYSSLSMQERYSVARLIGRLTHRADVGEATPKNILLVGPGRWGTTSPSLGIPVTFSEINTVSVLCEIAFMHEGLVPDVSLGTHFFNDLVEMDMLYVAVYPGRPGYRLNEEFFAHADNLLPSLLPEAQSWRDVVKVVGVKHQDLELVLRMNSPAQRGICYLREKDEPNHSDNRQPEQS